MRVPFVDLTSQYQSIQGEIDTAITEVLHGGRFIGGQVVETFEHQWAGTLGVKHCVGVANGTDSLEILLKAFGVGPGDEVIVPAYTWVSTAEAVVTVGATPVFVDTLDLFYTLDASKLESKITTKTKAIIPVHMAGLPADMDAIMAIARQYSLWVIEDCAQSHLAKYKGRFTGTIGHAGSFSFYPTKNLGAYGDAGAIVTNDEALAQTCREISNHGQLKRDVHLRAGRNSRLDVVQAAVLSVKLRYLHEWTARRIANARLYQTCLPTHCRYTPVANAYSHVYHLFLIQVDERDSVAMRLNEKGIGTMIHYPTPVPFTDAFRPYFSDKNDAAVSKHISERTLSLPIFPELSEEAIRYVCHSCETLG